MMWSFLDGEKVILASASPRRRRILETAGLDFIQRPAVVEEEIFNSRPSEQAAMELSFQKAAAALEKEQSGWIITADTVVVHNGAILGKPQNAEDARKILNRLSGAVHRVITGFTLTHVPSKKSTSDFESTEVEFYPLSGQEIDRYIETGEPMDKAGAYGIQGQGGLLIKRIDGCYFNVVGLPVAKLRNVWMNIIR